MNFLILCQLIIYFNIGLSVFYVNGENITEVTEKNTTELLEVNTTGIVNKKSIVADGRIVGGQKASAGQFPYVVSLQRRWGSHFCGGSLVSERWVVTAAHCMFGNSGNLIAASSFSVIVGEIRMSPGTKGRQQSDIQLRIVNPQYDADYLKNDIALLLVKTPFTFTTFVQPILLQTKQPTPGDICNVAGWGYPAENIFQSTNDLMYIKIPLLNQTVCRNLLGDLIAVEPSIICAGHITGGKDACQGDSGGPMVCGSTLSGVVSGGEGCARPNRPGFYTNIVYYKNWIDQVIHSDGKNTSYKGALNFPEYKGQLEYQTGKSNNNCAVISLVLLCGIYTLRESHTNYFQ